MLYSILFLFNIVVLVGIDRAIKLWAVANLAPVSSMPFIPYLIELRFALNEGMAFSMLSGKQFFLVGVTTILMLGIAYLLFFKSKGKTLQQVAFVLILAGGIGNLIDRATTGAVVDYINLLFMDFAIFNFADICVCVGAGLYVLCILLDGDDEASTPKAKENPTDPSPETKEPTK